MPTEATCARARGRAPRRARTRRRTRRPRPRATRRRCARRCRGCAAPSIRPIRRRKTTRSATVPATFTSDVASGIPQIPTRKSTAFRTTWSARFPSAIAVGTHGDWRLKNARFSISIVPLKVRPSGEGGERLRRRPRSPPARTRPARRGAGRSGSASTATTALAGRSRKPIWRSPSEIGRAEAVHVAARGEARERREEDGGDRDREDPLREHVDPEGGLDRARREVRVDVARGEERVDDLVEVDEPEAERDREHQHEDAPERPGRASRSPPGGVVEPAQPGEREQELDTRARRRSTPA